MYDGGVFPLVFSGWIFSGLYAPGAGVVASLNPLGRDPIENAGEDCFPVRVMDAGTLSLGPGPSDFLKILFGSFVPASERVWIVTQ